MAVRFSASTHMYNQNMALGTVTQWSVTCWAKISVDRNAAATLWQIDNGTDSEASYMGTAADGTSMGWSDDVAVPGTLINMVVGTWYYLGASGNGGSGTAVMRALGGTSFTSYTWSGGRSSSNAAWLRFGGDAPSVSFWMNGCIAAVKVWIGSTLTRAELESEMWSYVPRRATGLTAWYPLLKTETTDYSGNERTLTGGSGATTEDGPGVGWGWRRSGLYVPITVGVTHDLAADGLASSSGDADARTLYPLATDGLASGTGTAALDTLGSVLGDGLASSSGTAVALVGAALSSDGVATSSGAADLLAVFTLQGAGLASSTGSVDFLTAVVLASAGLATETAIGALGVTMPLAGEGAASTAGTASIGADVPLAAAGLATGTGTAALTHEGALAADGLASSAGTASLTSTHALGAAAAASSSGSAVVVVGLVFTGQASSSGSAALSLTIAVGTAVGLATTSGDSEVGLEVLIGAVGVPSSTGRAVIYIALPYTPGPTSATGRGPGGGVTGPSGLTRAEGVDTGRTYG